MKRILLSILLLLPCIIFPVAQNRVARGVITKKASGESLNKNERQFYLSLNTAGKAEYNQIVEDKKAAEKKAADKKAAEAAEKEAAEKGTVEENNSAIVKSVKNNWKKIAGVSGLGLMAGSYYLYKSGKGAQVVEFAKPYATAGLKGLGRLSGRVKNGFNALVAAVKTKIGK